SHAPPPRFVVSHARPPSTRLPAAGSPGECAGRIRVRVVVRGMRRLLQPVWLPAAVLLLAPLPGRAQDAAGWDSPRVLALMEAARARRQLPRGDSALENYQARANGYVYFYLDRRDSEERTLVKVDQVALDVYWAAPNRTKQRIIGLRDERRLPARI